MNEIITTKQALNLLGITPNLKGYHYIEKGVETVLEDLSNGKVPRNIMDIYGNIANHFGITITSVERGIRYAREIAKKKNTKLFNELFEFENIYNCKNSIFMCVIAEYLFSNF